MSRRQVLEDEISPDLQGRSERPLESEEDLGYQLSLPASNAGCQRFPWPDGVLANHSLPFFLPVPLQQSLEARVVAEGVQVAVLPEPLDV
ncbi:MAG: hypothetical protein WBP10_02625, partial [Thermoanaerobaculia bacterium]